MENHQIFSWKILYKPDIMIYCAVQLPEAVAIPMAGWITVYGSGM